MGDEQGVLRSIQERKIKIEFLKVETQDRKMLVVLWRNGHPDLLRRQRAAYSNKEKHKI